MLMSTFSSLRQARTAENGGLYPQGCKHESMVFALLQNAGHGKNL